MKVRNLLDDLKKIDDSIVELEKKKKDLEDVIEQQRKNRLYVILFVILFVLIAGYVIYDSSADEGGNGYGIGNQST